METTNRKLIILWIVAAGLAGNYLVMSLSPVQQSMQAALGFSDNDMSLLQGMALALPVILGGIPVGLLIDRKSRVGILLAAITTGIAGNIITALADQFWIIFVARALIGFSGLAISMAATSLIADASPAAQRGRAAMVLGWGQASGSSLIFAVCGYFLVYFKSNPDGWRLSLVLPCALLIPILIAVATLRDRKRGVSKTARATIRQELLELKSFQLVGLTLMAASVIVRMADGAAAVWTAPMLARNYGLSDGEIGSIMSAAILASGIGGPALAGTLADYCQKTGGPRKTITIFSYFVFASVPVGLYPLAPNATLAGIGFFAFFLVGAMSGIMLTALATVVIPLELFGLFFGILVIVSAILGTAVAPLMVSGLAPLFGGGDQLNISLAIVCVSASSLAALAFYRGSRHFPSTTPGLQTVPS